MIWNLQCFKTLTFAIFLLLLVHGIIGQKKDGSGRNSPKPNRGIPKSICAVPTLMNGEVNYNKTLDRFEFTCKTGFKLFGKKNLKCVNGSLNQPHPVCTAQGCSSFGLNNNLEMTEPEGYKGRVNEFKCRPGYTLKGPDRIHCNGERWSKGQPRCIGDVVTTMSPTTQRKEAEKTTPSVFLITYIPPPMESSTIFSSRWTTGDSVQSSAVHITSSLPAKAPDSHVTTSDFGDITSSISTDNKKLQSSAVTTASRGSEKAPRTSEMPEAETRESTLEDDSLSSFDHSMRRVTTQIDEKLELISQAATTEIDEPEQTMEEFPSSPAGVSLPSIDIQGVTDAGPSNEVELTRATSSKSDGHKTEKEPLVSITNTTAYAKNDIKTPEPLTSTEQDMRHTTTEAQLTKGSTIRIIVQAASTSPEVIQNGKLENTERQVTVSLIVLAVVAACILLALVAYVVVIKVKAYRSRDPSQNEHAAVAYAEKEANGSSTVNDPTVQCHITQL